MPKKLAKFQRKEPNEPNCFMGNLNCSNGINTTAMFFYMRCGIKGQACNTTYVRFHLPSLKERLGSIQVCRALLHG